MSEFGNSQWGDGDTEVSKMYLVTYKKSDANKVTLHCHIENQGRQQHMCTEVTKPNSFYL